MDEQQSNDIYAQAQFMQMQGEKRDDLVRYQLDPQQILDDAILEWQGLEKKDDGTMIRSLYRHRIINEKGAHALHSFIYPRLTKIVTLSDLSENEIRSLTIAFGKELIFMLGRNEAEFELSNYQDMDCIWGMATDLFYATWMKARDGKERDTLRKNINVNENSDRYMPPQQQPSAMSNPFKRLFGG